MVYQGMNSEYYIGGKVPYYRAATELDTAKTQECSGTTIPAVQEAASDVHMLTPPDNLVAHALSHTLCVCTEIPPVESPSGSSSHTATQMSTMEDAPEDILASLQFCPPQRHGSRDLDAPLPVRSALLSCTLHQLCTYDVSICYVCH